MAPRFGVLGACVLVWGCAASPPHAGPRAVYVWTEISEVWGWVFHRSIRVSEDGAAIVAQASLKDGKPCAVDGLWSGRCRLDGSQHARLDRLFKDANLPDLEIRPPEGPRGACGLSRFETITVMYFPDPRRGAKVTRHWIDHDLVNPVLPPGARDRLEAIDRFFHTLLAAGPGS